MASEKKLYLSAKEITKTFGFGRQKTVAVDSVNLDLYEGEVVSIVGESGSGTWLRITLREGKKRQIRKTGARIGLPVAQIKRVRIGTLKLGSLRLGEWRYLSGAEVRRLRQYAGLDKEEKSS